VQRLTNARRLPIEIQEENASNVTCSNVVGFHDCEIAPTNDSTGKGRLAKTGRILTILGASLNERTKGVISSSKTAIPGKTKRHTRNRRTRSFAGSSDELIGNHTASVKLMMGSGEKQSNGTWSGLTRMWSSRLRRRCASIPSVSLAADAGLPVGQRAARHYRVAEECGWRHCRTRCPGRYSCAPLYGAYGPWGGQQYWAAYSYSWGPSYYYK
jgi:hypothetical protein